MISIADTAASAGGMPSLTARPAWQALAAHHAQDAAA